MNKQDLIDFEEEIKELFLQGKIRAPIHLSSGNEEQLIKIFQEIKPEDWVFSTYRSHYHALLRGLPRDWLKEEILAGRSMHINNAKYKFFSSAIIGGCLPIAVGVAMALKRKDLDNKVFVFVGDMASETGLFHESSKYASRHNLPITFVVEDNGLSVNTPTKEVWGRGNKPQITRYKYKSIYPHQGAGEFVIF